MGYRGYNPYVSGDLEILGADLEVLGADFDGLDGDLDILGAVRRARNASGKASGSVRRTKPSQSRLLDLPIDSGATVAGGATLAINLQPLTAFRAEALMVDPTVAPSFIITAAMVGRKSQLVGAGSIACSLCAPNAPFKVQWDTAQQSEPIQITVNNTSGVALRFMGLLRGTIVE